MMNENKIFCGIDIAKRHFVVGLDCLKKTKTFTHNPKGIQQAIEYFKLFSVGLLVLESTGGIEALRAKTLYRAGFQVCSG